ncbi:hypothetical protein VNI00_017754 [Paramarasmius palmivorus]|uniref:Uncharacterized protein n=1 Tax=Paramarasmius palmivorus TaxID=297713 RepID=A0AAW0B4S6_9AGAR
MPWAKVRKSKAVRRQENREKSARHYARHRQEILARKKAARQLVAQGADNSREVTIHRSGEAESERRRKKKDQGEGARSISLVRSEFTVQLNAITQRLHQYTQGLASAFIESLYEQHMKERGGNASMNTPNPMLTEAETVILDLLNSCYSLENKSLQEGVLSAYQDTHKLTMRLKCILDSVHNLEMMIMDPEEDLEQAYSAGRLDFQKKHVQAWMNGTEPVPV